MPQEEHDPLYKAWLAKREWIKRNVISDKPMPQRRRVTIAPNSRACNRHPDRKQYYRDQTLNPATVITRTGGVGTSLAPPPQEQSANTRTWPRASGKGKFQGVSQNHPE